MLAREGDRGLTVATRTGDSRDVNGGGIDLTIPLALFEEIERMAVLGLVEDLTHVSVSAYSRAEQIAFRLTPRGRGLVDNLEGR